MKYLKPTTFGDSPAAIILVELLKEVDDTKLASRVGRIIGEFNWTLNEIAKLDARVGIKLVNNFYKEQLTFIDNIPLIPKKVKTFLCNVLTMRVRVWVIENHGGIPKKTRIKNQL